MSQPGRDDVTAQLRDLVFVREDIELYNREEGPAIVRQPISVREEVPSELLYRSSRRMKVSFVEAIITIIVDAVAVLVEVIACETGRER